MAIKGSFSDLAALRPRGYCKILTNHKVQLFTILGLSHRGLLLAVVFLISLQNLADVPISSDRINQITKTAKRSTHNFREPSRPGGDISLKPLSRHRNGAATPFSSVGLGIALFLGWVVY